MVFEDLYWMQKVRMILAVVVVDCIVVGHFIVSITPPTLYVGSEDMYFGGWKNLFL